MNYDLEINKGFLESILKHIEHMPKNTILKFSHGKLLEDGCYTVNVSCRDKDLGLLLNIELE